MSVTREKDGKIMIIECGTRTDEQALALADKLRSVVANRATSQTEKDRELLRGKSYEETITIIREWTEEALNLGQSGDPSLMACDRYMRAISWRSTESRSEPQSPESAS